VIMMRQLLENADFTGFAGKPETALPGGARQ
jgi:hypothetical protein